MWVEKYRPAKLSEMVNQADAVSRLSALLKKPQDMPHLLFTGPPGSGKTTMASAVTAEILGQYWRDFSLELNASDERGIDTIRQRIKVFASHTDRRVEVPFRVVLLDEADNMTHDAQTALRRIMEEFSAGTRFILTANYASSIIEPIQSRCAIFRFSRFSKEDVVNHLGSVCRKEKTRYTEGALALVYELSGGDLRQALNQLQAAASIGPVDEQNVKRIFVSAKRGSVKEMVQHAVRGDFQKAREMLAELLFVYGVSETDLLKYINEDASEAKGVDQAELAKVMAEYDYRLIQGAHPEIQLTALLAELGVFGRKAERA